VGRSADDATGKATSAAATRRRITSPFRANL